MRVGVFGSTHVAKSLGLAFLNEDHVELARAGEASFLVRESGKGVSSGTYSETANFGEVVVLAVLGTIRASRRHRPIALPRRDCHDLDHYRIYLRTLESRRSSS